MTLVAVPRWAESRTVHIATDAEPMQRFLSRVLGRAGANVVSLAITDAEPPQGDLLIVDDPKVPWARLEQLAAKTPVIVLTRPGQRGGTDRVITVHKPFTNEELQAACQRASLAVSSLAPASVSRERPVSRSGYSLLVVEDNPVNAKVAIALLSRNGHRVELATNGIDALAAVRRTSFDAIVMDIQMPEMDGLEATRRIRRDLSRDVPIVMLTANALPEDERAALEAGANAYLTKPLNLLRLETLLEALIRREGVSQSLPV